MQPLNRPRYTYRHKISRFQASKQARANIEHIKQHNGDLRDLVRQWI